MWSYLRANTSPHLHGGVIFAVADYASALVKIKTSGSAFSLRITYGFMQYCIYACQSSEVDFHSPLFIWPGNIRNKSDTTIRVYFLYFSSAWVCVLHLLHSTQTKIYDVIKFGKKIPCAFDGGGCLRWREREGDEASKGL